MSPQKIAAPLATPDEIRAAARRGWPKLVDAWIRGQTDTLFPMRLRVRLQPSSAEWSVSDIARAVNQLREHSKDVRGFGYHVEFVRRRSRQMGENEFPVSVSIESQDDLVRLIGKQGEFRQLQSVATQIRENFSELESWLQLHAHRLVDYADSVARLIGVTRYFIDHPLPDLYLRQLPIPADTKFIERHERILTEWLDKLLPPSAIRVDESTFARRYGLRDGMPHQLLRVLDPTLLSELPLPTDELSAPVRYLAALPVRRCTIVVVENRVNLLTLPPLPRSLALGGMGHAVTRLRDLPWLASNRIIYWGDLDVDGFRILANLRTLYPQVESFAMHLDALSAYADQITPGNGKVMSASAALTTAENAALCQCSSQNIRLEQERIPQSYVDKWLPQM